MRRICALWSVYEQYLHAMGSICVVQGESVLYELSLHALFVLGKVCVMRKWWCWNCLCIIGRVYGGERFCQVGQVSVLYMSFCAEKNLCASGRVW
jgi:hypothetical protein